MFFVKDYLSPNKRIRGELMKTKLFLSAYMLFFCALFLSVYALPPDIDQTDRVDGKDLIRFSRAWQKKTGEEG